MKNYGVKVSKKRTFGCFKFHNSKFLVEYSTFNFDSNTIKNEQQRYFQKTTCSFNAS